MRRKLALAVVLGDGPAAAVAVNLNYVGPDAPGLRRVRKGRGFAYLDADGAGVRDPATLARIRALAIPPAWTKVWIAADPDGHLQATGRDARGRKQYRYHARWRTVRDAAKYHRLIDFCGALPRLRRTVERDLRCACLCKRKVVATVVALMEGCQLRVGNDEYARANGSYGATTLRDRHARFRGAALELSYRGKSGIDRRVRVTDRRLTQIVRRCRDLPGQRLFQYVGPDGRPLPVTSTDVNEYIRDASGGPFTAKDYRTWAATLGAALILCALDRPHAGRAVERCVKEALAQVAARLGHTPAVCRKAYIHPAVIDGFGSGALAVALRTRRRRLDGADPLSLEALRAIEPSVARFLAAPLARAARAAAAIAAPVGRGRRLHGARPRAITRACRPTATATTLTTKTARRTATPSSRTATPSSRTARGATRATVRPTAG